MSIFDESIELDLKQTKNDLNVKKKIKEFIYYQNKLKNQIKAGEDAKKNNSSTSSGKLA